MVMIMDGGDGGMGGFRWVEQSEGPSALHCIFYCVLYLLQGLLCSDSGGRSHHFKSEGRGRGRMRGGRNVRCNTSFLYELCLIDNFFKISSLDFNSIRNQIHC